MPVPLVLYLIKNENILRDFSQEIVFEKISKPMEKYALILEPSDFSMCPCYMKMKALDLQGWSQLQSTFKFILHVFPSSSYFRNKFVSSFWPSFLFFFRSYILPCFICLNIFSVKPKFQTSTKPSNPIIQMWRNGNALAEFFREFFLVERA